MFNVLRYSREFKAFTSAVLLTFSTSSFQGNDALTEKLVGVFSDCNVTLHLGYLQINFFKLFNLMTEIKVLSSKFNHHVDKLLLVETFQICSHFDKYNIEFTNNISVND